MASPVTNSELDITKVRKDFPILQQMIYGNPLVYLDNAATSQKPRQVIDAISKYYRTYNSNIHRGVHFLSEEATNAYENARSEIASHINASSSKEINFVRGTTEAINLVAQSYGRKFIKKGDQILISAMEHHSNIVPWQMLCEITGAQLKVIPVNAAGELIIEKYEGLLNEQVKMVAVTHVSNSLGTINPVKELIAKAHDLDIPVLLDGAQAIPHQKVDVRDLDADFYAFSGHKAFGPTGIGVLYGKEDLLEKMDPYMGGGEMISEVTFEKTTYNELPFKFEAGTPNICGAIAFATALSYLRDLGLDRIAHYEQDLLNYATQRLLTIDDLRIIGTAKEKTGVISFMVADHHPYDIGVLLDKLGIAIRTGHHCTQPLMDKFSIPGTCRASFVCYNTREEADVLVEGVKRVVKMM